MYFQDDATPLSENLLAIVTQTGTAHGKYSTHTLSAEPSSELSKSYNSLTERRCVDGVKIWSENVQRFAESGKICSSLMSTLYPL